MINVLKRTKLWTKKAEKKERLDENQVGWGLIQKLMLNEVWWYIPVISVLKTLRQKNLKFKASIGYLVKPGLKNKDQV
jgi:hypothetical protein